MTKSGAQQALFMKQLLLLSVFALSIFAACGGHGLAPVSDTGAQLTQSTIFAAFTAPPPTRLKSSFGRMGLFQVFDDFLPTGTTIPGTQIVQDAPRYDAVWGARQPASWDQGNPSMLVSRYIIMQE